MARLVTLLVAAVLTNSLTAMQASDAARVLADMRQALGGDAALAAVQAFSVDGSETRSFPGHTAVASIELVCLLPDRFIRVRRVPGPFGDVVETHGFNGDVSIRRRASNIPYPPDPFASDTPDQRAERERRAVRSSKHEFARFAVAMIGLPAVDPVDVSYDGQSRIDGIITDVLLLKAADGYTAQLFVDAATHLPKMISWAGAPEITMSTSSIESVRDGRVISRTPQPPMIPVDLSKPLPSIERRIYFTDYRVAGGLNWPHRFEEIVDGSTVLDTRLGKFKINPRIDPKRFAPGR